MRMNHSVKFLGIVTLSMLLAVSCFAGEVPVQSGIYDEMLIGYDTETKLVSGYYRSETGAGQFSCIFYFDGKNDQSPIKIESYFPKTPMEKIYGQLSSSHSANISVLLTEEHGGCWNVQHFSDQTEPATFDLVKSYPWKSIRIVKVKKAYLFDTPNSTTHRKAYLVEGDGVGVKLQTEGWLQIDYTGGNKPITGWMQASNFYAVNFP